MAKKPTAPQPTAAAVSKLKLSALKADRRNANKGHRRSGFCSVVFSIIPRFLASQQSSIKPPTKIFSPIMPPPTSNPSDNRLSRKRGTVLEPSTVRVLVVDDYDPWRSFTISTLQKQAGFEVVGEVSDGLEAVLVAARLRPDLILLDIGLPTLNGIEAARRMHERSPKSRILFVSENRFPDVAEEALATGAGGYVVKSEAASDLMPAVEAVLRGRQFVSASLAGHVLATARL